MLLTGDVVWPPSTRSDVMDYVAQYDEMSDRCGYMRVLDEIAPTTADDAPVRPVGEMVMRVDGRLE